MKNIVITGSTRGIGYGLADAFLAKGCAVTVSGRAAENVERAVASFSPRHNPVRVFGHACEVSSDEQVQALWAAARDRFGQVDVWINNAGIANPLAKFWELSPGLIKTVVETNVLGSMYGSIVALREMLKQGFGSLYNMEGYGSRGSGRMVAGLMLYGTTKAALGYFDHALIQEVEGTPVRVGIIRPGMVATGMLTSQYEGRPEEWERARRIFNLIAEPVETVAPWIAEKVLANAQNGAVISYGSSAKIFWRFLTAPFSKREIFPSKSNLK